MENLRKLLQSYLQVLFLNNFTDIFDDWKGVRVGVGGEGGGGGNVGYSTVCFMYSNDVMHNGRKGTIAACE